MLDCVLVCDKSVRLPTKYRKLIRREEEAETMRIFAVQPNSYAVPVFLWSPPLQQEVAEVQASQQLRGSIIIVDTLNFHKKLRTLNIEDLKGFI